MSNPVDKTFVKEVMVGRRKRWTVIATPDHLNALSSFLRRLSMDTHSPHPDGVGTFHSKSAVWRFLEEAFSAPAVIPAQDCTIKGPCNFYGVHDPSRATMRTAAATGERPG